MMLFGTKADARPKELKGRTVLFSLIAFFVVVASVNAVMVTAAVKTFGGVETESSYKAGLAFAREIAAADAQQARHWQVRATVGRDGEGQARIEVLARDASQLPLRDVTALVRLSHPTDRRLDQAVAMTADGPGRFRGTAAFVAGQWDLVIDLDRGGERVFRSRNRVILR
jgi:nitrogen fixation protein FixH